MKFGIQFTVIQKLFKACGLQKAGTCRDNLIKMRTVGIEKTSGGYQASGFYNDFPEIKIMAKIFVSEQSQKKSCSFKMLDLCEYIDTLFYEISITVKETKILVRSETAVREDLKKGDLVWKQYEYIF